MIRVEVLVILYKALVYLMVISGIGLLFFNTFQLFYSQLRMRRRLNARGYFKGNVEKMLSQALYTALGKSVSPAVFIITLIAIFLLFFLISINTLSFIISFLISAIIALLPCLLLWIRLTAIRRKGSHEGEQLISEFLRQYRLSNYNIYEALERVVEIKVDIKITRKLLFKLLFDLRNTGNSEKIKKATDDFAYAIQTNWSRMFSHNIYIGSTKGTNVSLAIEDILIQLREARALVEERKRLNNEAMRMTYYMVPLIYGTTIIMAVKYLGLSLGRFLHNQFYTQEGLLLFILMIFLFVGNIALLSLVSNQRFDY